MSFRKTLSLILPALLALTFALAGTASADSGSIVYIKGYDVWLANPDGSGAVQVTRDGDYEHPWLSPSQADDGTIAASHGNYIVRMEQNGQVLNRMDPKPLYNSVSHPVDGVPVDVAISPDGKLIAYTFVSYECPIGVECGARAATGYTAADHLTPADRYGSTYFSNPSWVGNNRTIQSGGYGSQINFHDLGQGDPVHWFDDSDYASPSTDLDDGELSTDGSRFAAIRGYGDSAHIIWYSVTGNARTGTPPAYPEAMCVTGELKGIAGPSFSPDGHSLAWAEPDGIWTKPDLDTCGSPQPALTIPGGSEPDWGPAAVDPGPLLKFAVKPVKASLGKVLKKGLRMKVTTPAAGRVNAKVKLGSKTVATGSARAAAAGKTVVTARFNSGARKSIAKRKTVRMTLNVTFGSQKAKLVLGF